MTERTTVNESQGIRDARELTIKPPEENNNGRHAMGSPALTRAMEQVVTLAGGEPDSQTGKRIREMMHTAVKLMNDGADDGELKLVSRSLKELRYALKVFRPYRETPKIAIFGSARTPEDDPTYQACLQFGRLMAENGWMVITGAGGGIMAAGNGGAGREASFGVSIRLPFETNANPHIVGDPKLINFRYFFTRKLTFMWQSSAVALFAGGFGTQDEGFEALTLVQTGKAPTIPIVMIDAPGRSYWKRWDQYVREELLEQGLISPEDLALYRIFDNPQEATDHVLNFYRNYHSQRFVNDVLVLRMRRPLLEEQVIQLNDEFADLVKEGRIEQGGPLPQEQLYPDLPRLRFVFVKRAYGRLRMLVDRINELDAENHPA
ncbi:MAG: TIGR00730 family Rossman fold protein [Phycisphaeraceae bacterium]